MRESRFIGEISKELVDRQYSQMMQTYSSFGYGRSDGYSCRNNSSYAGGYRSGYSSGHSVSKFEQKKRTLLPNNPSSSNNSIGNIKYSAGERVRHKTFGDGMITSVMPMGNDSMLEIAFDRVGTKKVMANFAKLEKI